MKDKLLYTVTAILFAIGTLATGCASPARTSPPKPERYYVGYSEGCDAGFALAGSSFYERIESAEPIYHDFAYVTGWYEGYWTCKWRQDRIHASSQSFFGVEI